MPAKHLVQLSLQLFSCPTPNASRFTSHIARPTIVGAGPPSMPRAHLGTALPTRQEPTCYEMLRFPASFKSLARHVFVAS